VIVIGAGVAGLAAARELNRKGRPAVVLEASHRIGGRMWTDRSLGTPVDMGAAWIEGGESNPVHALAREAGLQPRTDDADSLIVEGDGRRLNEDETQEIERQAEELHRRVARISDTVDRDISVGEGVRRALRQNRLTPHEKRALDWFLAALALDAGEDLERISLRHGMSDDEFSGEDFLALEYGRIAEHLAGGLDVRLGHVVLEIEQGAREVRVSTSQGPFVAKSAVVAIPLGVLKKGRVKFHPELSAAKREAIRRLGVGVVNKVALKFEKAWWPPAGHFGCLSGDFPEFLNLHPYTSAPILVGFVAGDRARTLEGESDRDQAATALRVLRRAFGSSVPEPVASRVTRWGRNPFFNGSYSHVPVGGFPKDYDALAEPAGRLFFAGEATNRRYPATVHGAFLSGLRAAAEVNR